MDATSFFLVALAALLLDAAGGYPDAIFRAIGHPVTWIGVLINWLDRNLNSAYASFSIRRLAGVLALAILIAVPVGCAYAIERLAMLHSIGLMALVVVTASLFASRSLYNHVRDVALALETSGLEAGRTTVARIVGRDPDTLDEPGVARAAIESLAENASDGVVAPVLWFVVGGLPGLAAYKAINTADSMIGHRNEKYEAFGWASARLDDLVNLPASRLTGLLFAMAAMMLPGGAPRAAIAAMRRDASGHRSPNAGWPESAMAGALGLKLNGPRRYGGVMTNDAYMGVGRREATAADIRRGLRLSTLAWMLMLLLVGIAYSLNHFVL